jgi:hypothetical protein
MRLFPLGLALASLVACSVVNSPDDPQPANNDDAGGGTPTGCPEGFEVCDGACVNVTNDPAHCGGCGSACAEGEVCGVGQCLSECQAGTVSCGGSCVDLDTDLAHCGACDNACPADNATAECTDGACSFTCESGFDDCDGDPSNACEQDIATDAANCGGCGKTCVALANSEAACAAGACVLGACKTGFGNCDGTAANGCETDLRVDPGNCMGCGTMCGGATPNCIGGCTDAYWQSGVQNGVNLANVVASGWEICLQEGFDENGTSVSDTFDNQCDGIAIMYACRPNGSATLQVAAMALRDDVMVDCANGVAECGGGSDCTHEANGVGWYFNDSWSIGIANAGDPVNRCSCDTDDTNAAQRICWHTGSGSFNTGYRCGADEGISGTFERLILHYSP